MTFELQLAILGLAGFVFGILSGISGGGAGLVMTPLAIAIGLPPQTAVATLKMAGLGAAFGGLTVFLKSGHIRKDILRVMVPIVVFIGLATPFVFKLIEGEIFQKIIGVLVLLLVPTLFIKKTATSSPSKRRRGLGFILYSLIMAIQALFSAGAGVLATFVLTLLFGTTKLEANATKRAVTAFMVPITFTGLLIAGFVSLPHGIVLLIAGFIGTHIGSKIALKKGEDFVTIATAIAASISGIWLLFG